MDQTVQLDGPRTLTLTPTTIAAVMDALAEKPFKISAGPINEIMEQLKAYVPPNGPI